MVSRLKYIGLAVCAACLFAPVPSASAATHVMVTADTLNIRANPGTNSQIVTTIPKETKLPIISQQKDWIQVKLSNGKTGWVLNKYVKAIDIPQIKYVKSSVDMLNVRSAPNANGQIIQVIDKNSTYQQMSKQGEWVQIKLSGNANGWVHTKYIAEAAAEPAKPAPPPAAITALPQSVTVIGDNVNVRSQATTNSQIITTLKKGTSLPVSSQQGDWYQVRTADGKTGWIANWLVSKSNAGTVVTAPPTPVSDPVIDNSIPIDILQPSPSPESVIKVLAPNTPLWYGPGVEHGQAGVVQPGETYPIVNAEGQWYLIRLNNGGTAYIDSSTVERQEVIPQSPGGILPTGEQQVFIYHTHNRESWRGVASNTSGTSVDDPVNNISQVGKYLGQLLQAKGVNTLVNQDDFAQRLAEQKKTFAQSYSESYKAVSAAAMENPGLKFFFDIHRDSDEPRSKVALTINDKTYARILFVIGTANPNYAENKKLAEYLHMLLESEYPGLSRGVLLKDASQGNGEYNQSISTGSLLLEFGGTNNTPQECFNTAEAFANVFMKYVTQSRQNPSQPL